MPSLTTRQRADDAQRARLRAASAGPADAPAISSRLHRWGLLLLALSGLSLYYYCF